MLEKRTNIDPTSVRGQVCSMMIILAILRGVGKSKIVAVIKNVNQEQKGLLDSKMVHNEGFKRIDRHKFEYMCYGAMVRSLGGWKDPAAIKGSTTCFAKCLAMGEPWCKQHPQTELVECAKLAMEWEEVFTEELGLSMK